MFSYAQLLVKSVTVISPRPLFPSLYYHKAVKETILMPDVWWRFLSSRPHKANRSIVLLKTTEVYPKEACFRALTKTRFKTNLCATPKQTISFPRTCWVFTYNRLRGFGFSISMSSYCLLRGADFGEFWTQSFHDILVWKSVMVALDATVVLLDK